MQKKVFLEWENIDMKWENIDMLWEDISILIEIGEFIKRGGGSHAYIKGNPWDITKKEFGEEKTKKFIKMICIVNELKYEDVIDINSEIKINVEHIEKTFNESKKIGIKIDF